MISKKKVIRDIKESKEGYIACILVIIIGLMMYTSFSLVIVNLEKAKNDFYYNQNFAHVFANVKEMPYKEVTKLKRVKGIKDAQGRLVKDVRAISKESNNVYLRLISLDLNLKNHINSPDLIKGENINRNSFNIWIDNKFFEASNLKIADKISIICEGNKKELEILGIGRSPEFIYALRNSSDIYPNPKEFGIAFMDKSRMDILFKEGSNINDIVITLEDGYKFDDVKNELEGYLKKYGLLNIYERKDQSSNLLLEEEINGLKSMSKTLPVLFLSVAGMILYIILKRMAQNQRGQIGLFKAMGYTQKEILIHYLSYPMFIGLIGGVLGSICGYLLSIPLTKTYQIYFNMPNLNVQFSFEYLLLGIVLSLVFSLVAGYNGCKNVLILEPYESLRPEVPKFKNKIFLEKVVFIWNSLTIQGKMALRNVFRNIGRSLFIVIGIAFTSALLILSASMLDLSNEMLFNRFENEQLYDLKIDFNNYYSSEKIKNEMNKYSITRIENLLQMPVKIKHKWHKKSLAIIGVQNDSYLYRILDKEKNRLNISSGGIYISDRLSKLLDLRVGDYANIEFLDFENKKRKVIIAGIIPQYLGINAYCDIDYLKNILGSSKISNSLILKINNEEINKLEKDYSNLSSTASISRVSKLIKKYKELLKTNMLMMSIMVVFGIITIFAVIYNSSIIGISERKREISSMVVLGMSNDEVCQIISFEQWFLAFIGITFSIPLGKVMLIGLSNSISNDIYSMPTKISIISIIIAIIMVIISIYIAQYMSYKKIKNIDIVDVLKERE